MDELLSAYLDGQLTADELRQVESLLEEPAARQRLEQLRAVGLRLRTLAAQPSRGLSKDFSDRVVALAIRRYQSDVSCSENKQEAVDVRPLGSSSGLGWNGKLRNALGLIAAVAATILLAVWMPRLLTQSSSSPPIAADSPLANQTNTQPQSLASSSQATTNEQHSVGKGDLVASGRLSSAQLTYTMVLDVEITLQASQQQLLRSVLAKHGIQIAKTVVVNSQIEAALSRMRHTVPHESLPSISELYWVHAPIQVLDQAIQEIQSTVDQFPVCRFDLAFETPAASLSQAIAATAQLTSSAGSIAIPVIPSDKEQYRQSPFESVAYQGTLVSANLRPAGGIESRDDTTVAAGQGNLLLLVRLP